MINKKLLKQVLRFEKTQPVFSIVRDLNEMIVKYQEENSCYFFSAKRGQKASVIDQKLFFEFISSELLNGKKVRCFDDVKKIVHADTREDNIKYSGDSKTNYVRVFDNVVVLKKAGEVAQLLQSKDLQKLEKVEGFVAVENGESFLNIETIADKFKYKHFIYLGGTTNSLTREFLKDKRVEFFLDFDIASLNIYESFTCKEKSYFIPEDLESFFCEHPNTKLYKNQLSVLKENYSDDLSSLVHLIKKYNTVVEQEVYR